MMNFKRITTAFLALVMACGALVPASIQPVAAAYSDKVNEDGDPLISYTSHAYSSPEAKLNDMIIVKEENGARIWYEEFTGEIAFENLTTGQILFSNPWDVAADYNKASQSTKNTLLSQVLVTFTDNGVEKTMNSYAEAALRNQIIRKNIKGGIRVEYTIGEEQTNRLVPRLIPKARFEELILGVITDDWVRGKVLSYYSLKDPTDATLTERSIKEMNARFPITKKMAVYVCDTEIVTRELRTLENYIKTWCPNYTYEQLDEDHMTTGYSGVDAAPPMFKLAIEYSITENGDLEARLSANSIRYDESAFKLKTITLLPFMGSGSNNFPGYTFIPDGSGTLVRFEDVKGSTYNVSGQMYGADYAYHEISNQHTEVMRWPVYGVVTNYDYDYVYIDPVAQKKLKDQGIKDFSSIEEPRTLKQDVGFLAIITEGDSMATLMSVHGGTLHSFNTVYAKFAPRPSDSYNLADSISVSSNTNTTFSVESDRRYTGSYRIVYRMLTDEGIAAEKNLKDTFSCDYIGMANSLRAYLIENGVLTPLTDTTDHTPLYIETFGSMETTQRILSFPVTVDTPLTTFENVKTMYDELTSLGVGRINFRLTGYANGGMVSTVPYNIEWVDVLGGEKGFEDLLVYANEKNFGVFPDFDFAYVVRDELFDGMSLSKYAVKTIDDRYTSRRHYDAATQTFVRDGALCISASAYEHFYEKFSEEYLVYGHDSISVSTLGEALNSDFDTDDPYNREDSRRFTQEVLAAISEDFANVMVDSGNFYSVGYANHILGISTDSSRFIQASETIPFMGIVMHGYKYFTGEPINMEGDIDSAILKSIENGSYLYFVLSYQNTNYLKESISLSKYYSVSYEILRDEVVKYYTVLDEATKDLQTSLIVDHEFIFGERVPDADEIAADQAAEQAILDAEAAAQAQKLADWERDKEYAIRNGLTIPAKPTFTTKEPAVVEDGTYVKTKYTTTSGSIVRVEYEGDVNFILNYNSFDVTVKYEGNTYTIEALSFVRID